MLTDGGASPETAALPVLSAGGFGASADAYAWERDSDRQQMRLWFLSLLGPQQALKALWARLIKGDVATLSFEALGRARFCALASDGARGWSRFGASLPSAGGYHLVLLPAAARYLADRTDFLLLPRSPLEAPVLHWRFLNRRADVPLHASWANWLWERAERSGEAVVLESAGVLAYRCQPNLTALSAAVSAAVRRELLAVPDHEQSHA
jgi:hypothetical protein